MKRILHAIALVTCLAASTPAAQKPNIIFILADDLGWSDTGCYGSTYHRTPHIDALASRSLRLTQAYAANPLCSPTRSSILTGLYPARTGITAPVCHLPQVNLEKKHGEKGEKAIGAESVTRLKTEYVTVAERLKSAGYVTAHFGKWHLGREPYDPKAQGFDSDWPHTPSAPGPGGKNGYFAPWDFVSDPTIQGEKGEHIEDRMSREAAKFIAVHKDHPFFLNYWMFSVHSPWMAKPELVEKYRKSADPKSPQRNPVYAGMVQSLDDAVGRILQAVTEAGIADRTIIVFTSDNGGVHWSEGRQKTVFGMDDPPTSNDPLRGGKATIYEGGTREPCLVLWPGVTKAGATSEALLSSVDWFPTILEMTGVEAGTTLPSEAGIAKTDGVSQVAAFRGTGAPRDTVFCHFPHGPGVRPGFQPSSYVRKGDWKLIRFYCDHEDQTDRHELYNLKEDLGEAHDLAAREPARVKELGALLDGFLKDTEAVVPKPNPSYRLSRNWQAGGDAVLTVADGIASAETKSGRPTIQLLKAPEGDGKMTVVFRMRGRGSPQAYVLWGTKSEPGFAATRRGMVEVADANDWHEYRVEIAPTAPLTQLRIDGSLSPAKVEYDWIKLLRADGSVVAQWDF